MHGFLERVRRIVAVLTVYVVMVQAQAREDRAGTTEPVLNGVTFTEVTDSSGLQGLSPGRTCACVDMDGDGYVDIMTTAGLFQNDGSGSFKRLDVPGSEGIWADLNNNGRPDFLSLAGKGRILLNEGGGSFKPMPFAGNPLPARPRAACADADGDGWVDVFITNYEEKFGGPIRRDLLFFNAGDGSFRAPVTLTDDGWAARGANWADFDNDGDQDLYVSNYRLMPNALWVNDGRGTFTDQARQRGVYGDARAGKQPASKWYSAYEYTGHTIGSSWGDLNNDGYLDLVVVNFSHPPTFQNRVQICINSGPPDYTFSNRNRDAKAGIYWQESYAKAALADVDNDGDLDLYITTVYPRDSGELFENDGSGTFTPVGKQLGVRLKKSYQVNWIDVDNDGHMDLLVGGRLFRNSGSGFNWIKVRSVGGAGSNHSAIGARITVTAGDRTQIREVSAGNSGNQDPFVAHFGLATHQGPVTVRVRFPSGRIATTEATVNTLCTVREADATAPAE